MPDSAHRSRPVTLDTLDTLGDLRRRSRADVAQRILLRAAHLPDRDRALLESLYRDGMSAKDLARLARIPPRALRLRVHRLVRRLSSPRFAFVLVHAPHWPPLRRRVAELHILEGRSIRSTAALLGITLHQVRAHLAWIGMQIEAREPSATLTRTSPEHRP